MVQETGYPIIRHIKADKAASQTLRRRIGKYASMEVIFLRVKPPFIESVKAKNKMIIRGMTVKSAIHTIYGPESHLFFIQRFLFDVLILDIRVTDFVIFRAVRGIVSEHPGVNALFHYVYIIRIEPYADIFADRLVIS